MKTRLAATAAALALTGAAVVTTPGPAPAAGTGTGTQSLATVLAADGHHFDKNRRDFDVVDKLVTRILTDKPGSRLAILADGSRRVTAFLPTDGAMRRSISDINDQQYGSERSVFRAIWETAGPDSVERILLYHLVRGKTLTYEQLRDAAPTSLTTMQGGTVRVRITSGNVMLHDFNPDSPNSRVFHAVADINAGNRQIAHGIAWVISPD
jgi:uncharacterized surface protein with fasciclin (FAS1) repeats